jgi:hypothetical protein
MLARQVKKRTYTTTVAARTAASAPLLRCMVWVAVRVDGKLSGGGAMQPTVARSRPTCHLRKGVGRVLKYWDVHRRRHEDTHVTQGHIAHAWWLVA